MTGKTIRIYLVDGSPTGVLTAEIMNWTGKVTVGPRSSLAELARRPDVSRTGIYLLVGPDPDSPARDRVYVGEGDKVLTRLAKHEGDDAKDFWTRTVVVTSKDENLTKAHVRYLESRLVQIITAAGRATLVNGTAPPAPPLPEPDVADMEFFLAQVQLVKAPRKSFDQVLGSLTGDLADRQEIGKAAFEELMAYAQDSIPLQFVIFEPLRSPRHGSSQSFVMGKVVEIPPGKSEPFQRITPSTFAIGTGACVR